MITKSRVSGDVLGPDSGHAHWECQQVEVNTERLNEGAPPADSHLQQGFVEQLPFEMEGSVSLGEESIAYATRKLHNTCLHNRRQLLIFDEPYPVVFRLWDEPQANYVWRIKGKIHNLPALCGLFGRGIRGRAELGSLEDYQVPWSPNWSSDYSGRAVQTMWPGVQSGNLSLSNFLLELRDFKRSYASAKKLRERLTGISRLMTMASKKGTSRKERVKLLKRMSDKLDIGRVVAEANLEYSFAYAPFVADCQKIWQQLQGISAECDRLKAHCGRWLTSHYAERIPAPATHTTSVAVPYAYGSGVSQNSFTIMRTVEHLDSMYHATMDYTYELPPEAAWVLRWRTTLDRLGINLDPAIPWNAYPWTFVVDWAVRVGDFLHQFRVRNVRPIVSILGFCHSVKHRRSVALHVVQGANSLYSVGPDILAAREVESTYVREPTVPNFYSAIQLSGISVREFTLAASLLRVRKHGRRYRNG